jgi:hypothetical protein
MNTYTVFCMTVTVALLSLATLGYMIASTCVALPKVAKP